MGGTLHRVTRLEPQDTPKRRGPTAAWVASTLLVPGLVACQPPIPPPEPTPPAVDPVTDHEGPWLETEPISEPQSIENGILIDATATDPSGVYAVFLHFKPGNAAWETQRMTPMGSDGYYATELDASQLYGAGSVSYYLEAADATPYHNTSYSPSTGAEDPYRFNLVSTARLP